MIEQRKLRYLLTVVILLLALIPCTAFAEDYEGGGGGSHDIGGSYPNFGTVWYGPEATANRTHTRYGVVAYTSYDAAMYNLFGASFDFSSLSATKKRKLLNGSDFYTFANLFRTGKPELDPDNIIFNDDFAIVSSWNSAREMYGETYCYSAMYDDSQHDAAYTFARNVLLSDDNEGSGSGGIGSSSPNDMRMIAYRWNTSYTSVKFGETYYYVNGNPPTPDTMYVIYNAYMRNLMEENPGYVVVGHLQNLSRLMFLLVPEGKAEIEMGETDLNGTTVLIPKNIHVAKSRFAKIVFNNLNASWFEVSDGDEELDTVTFTMPDSLQPNSISWYNQEWNESTSSPMYVTDYQGEAVPDPDPTPPEPWPDPPSDPVYGTPEIPEPGDPTIPTPPNPIDPKDPNPWLPIPDIDIDITGEDFQDLLDALNEHCIHLQNSIQSNIQQLWNLQSSFFKDQFQDLFSYLDDIFKWLGNDVIVSSFTDLKKYLNDLFQWLSERMDYNITVEGGQYDDTSVIYWLKQIWASLPTGINTRPTDPVTNPTGWWDWLTQLLNNLAADLMALGHDRLAGVLEMLNQLRNKFPFSLPWDIAALLGLLVAVPECPEFDVPAYALGSNMELEEVGSYHITLEPYEDVWEGVKWIETLAFAVYLITHTGGLMDMVTKTVRPR